MPFLCGLQKAKLDVTIVRYWLCQIPIKKGEDLKHNIGKQERRCCFEKVITMLDNCMADKSILAMMALYLIEVQGQHASECQSLVTPRGIWLATVGNRTAD